MEFYQYIQVGQKLEVTAWPEDSDDQSGLCYPSYIKDIDTPNHRILVDSPPLAREDLRRAMISGNVVRLTVHSRNGKLIVDMKIADVQHTGLKGHWLYLVPGNDYEIVQRRRHARIPMIEPLEIEAAEGEPKIRGKTHNLSGGGLRFACPRKFTPGQDIRIHLKLDGSPACLEAKIIRSSENEQRFAREEDRYVTTIFFVNLTPHLEKMLIRETFRRELAWQSKQKGMH